MTIEKLKNSKSFKKNESRTFVNWWISKFSKLTDQMNLQQLKIYFKKT